jgi:hypothetical protein
MDYADHTLRFGCMAIYMMMALIAKKIQSITFYFASGYPPVGFGFLRSKSVSVRVDNL